MNRNYVLVIENDGTIAEVMSLCLSEGGHRTCTAKSWAEAVDVVTSMGPPSLIIIDGFLGSERQIEKIRPVLPHPTPVLLVTTSPSAWEMAQSIKADEYLIKPFNLHELEHKVNTLFKVVQ